jgi:hypothetical protein
MVCDEIARRLPSKAAQRVEEPGRRFEGHICSRQSGVKILTFGGIDTFYGGGYPDPYVDTAIQDAQCAAVVVHSIYTPGAGHFSHTYWRIYWGQNYLAQLSEETGGESYYFLGGEAPVSFEPYLNSDGPAAHASIPARIPCQASEKSWNRTGESVQ